MRSENSIAGLAGAVVIGTIFLLLSAPAGAHFLLNLNVRIFHIEHLADGLAIYMRLPMPYLVADKIGPVTAEGLPKPAPFTTNTLEGENVVHFVDPIQLRADPTGLGELAAEGLRLEVDGGELEGQVEQVQVRPVGSQPPFATLAEAKAAFRSADVYPNDTATVYVGDAVVDVLLHYPAEAITAYTIQSRLNPGLSGQEKTANLILDHGPGGTKIFRARGLLGDPISITRSTTAAIYTFIKEGVRHILEGLDHVLFVLCLSLGAPRLKSLIWRATGFTIGHSLTLTLGFFGFVPAGDWFVPTVEAGIALSIIYAAVVALRFDGGGKGERRLFFVTSAIGLLHGLGFSFVLHNILQVNSPNLWQSLLAFNIGVEIGQVLIILITWPLFILLRKFSKMGWRLVRTGIATACIVIATVWTAQRALQVVGSASAQGYSEANLVFAVDQSPFSRDAVFALAANFDGGS